MLTSSLCSGFSDILAICLECLDKTKQTKKPKTNRQNETFRFEAAEQISGEVVGTVGVGVNNAALRGYGITIGRRPMWEKETPALNIDAWPTSCEREHMKI